MPQFQPIFPYYGGKSRLIPYLLKILPAHRIYVEVFGGAANLLFAKPRSEIEVYNDIWKELVVFFRMLRDKPRELASIIERTPHSLSEFELSKETDSENDELEIARRVYVRIAQSYCGTGQSWGRFISRKLRSHDIPSFAVKRIKGVHLDNLDFRELIPKYDGKDTLFYCDPPYMPTRSSKPPIYSMSVSEHGELVRLLLDVRGKVILSGYPNPIYHILEECGWSYFEVSVDKSISGRDKFKGCEGIWTNYDTSKIVPFTQNKSIDDYY